MNSFFLGIVVAFMACVVGVPLIFGWLSFLGVLTTVPERSARVFVLFGKVIGVIDQPGLHFLPTTLGFRVLLVRWFGKIHTLDLRLDQEYLRSLPVNSEEGAPMGIGVWYEMMISDPVAYLFKNADPRGSLNANVSNSTVRCLSNLPLEKMLEDRHFMSQSVRHEVSSKSREWGYQLGSVYVRKVHFRDVGMIKQIEEKVVNRLRQVTSAIRQDGANQVNVITSTAERQAAVEFAKAQATRPQIVGAALAEISQDPVVAAGMIELLQIQKLQESNAEIVMVPVGSGLASSLLATQGSEDSSPPPVVR